MSFDLLYKKSSEKAKTALCAVQINGIRKGKLQDKARDYIYDNLSKNEKDLYEYVGILNFKKKNLLKSNNQYVKFSMENLTKNIIKHPELLLEEYLLIPEIIEKTQCLLFFEEENRKKIFCYCKKDKYYKLVVKSTQVKSENLLQSFYSISLQGINKDKGKKGIKIIYDNLQ